MYKFLINHVGTHDFIRQYTTAFQKTLEDLLDKCIERSGSEIFIAVAYIKQSGIEQIISKFKKILLNGGKIRILTCLDFGLTEYEALVSLISLQNFGDIKIHLYFNKNGNFHPKLYIFRGEKFQSFIIGSHNLSLSAFNKNVECAICSDDESIFEDVLEYFYLIWRDSINVDLSIIELYKEIDDKVEEQRTLINNTISSFSSTIDVTSEEHKEDLIKNCFQKIDYIIRSEGIKRKIVFWRDVAIDEVITLLKHSSKLDKLSPRQMILSLIEDDLLHYKKTTAVGSWLNYSKFMHEIGYWADNKLSELGHLALTIFKQSSLRFVTFLQYSLLVFGQLYVLCVAVDYANSRNIKKIKNKTLKKDEWIDIIFEDVTQFLKKNNYPEIGRESLKRYFPGIFSKFGLSDYIFKIDNSAYFIQIEKLAEFIIEYSSRVKLVPFNFQDDSLGYIEL